MEKSLLLAGGSGFIGSALGEHFAQHGWQIHVLTRSVRHYQLSFPCVQHHWNGFHISPHILEKVSVVINLAGQGIADRRWTPNYRRLLMDSRVRATRALAQSLDQATKKPSLVIQASAVGFYGLQSRPGDCHEETGAGDDFLSGIGKAWEKEATSMTRKTRLIIMRLGLVLGWEGGALEKLWDIYARAAGSVLGDGTQWMNWVHLKDVLRFCKAATDTDDYHGIYNMVAPGNVTNRSFHCELASHTPSAGWLQAPGVALKLILGTRSDLLLKSPRVIPARLNQSGFKFFFPDLSTALNNLLEERACPSFHFIKKKQWLPLNCRDTWNVTTDPQYLTKVTPDWLNLKLKGLSLSSMGLHTKIDYSLKLHGIPLSWRSTISHWQEENEFVEEQEKGPFNRWYHRHLIYPFVGGSMLEDRVEYRLPAFPASIVVFPLVKSHLEHIFQNRREVIASLPGLSAVARFTD